MNQDKVNAEFIDQIKTIHEQQGQILTLLREIVDRLPPLSDEVAAVEGSEPAG